MAINMRQEKMNPRRKKTSNCLCRKSFTVWSQCMNWNFKKIKLFLYTLYMRRIHFRRETLQLRLAFSLFHTHKYRGDSCLVILVLTKKRAVCLPNSSYSTSWYESTEAQTATTWTADTSCKQKLLYVSPGILLYPWLSTREALCEEDGSETTSECSLLTTPALLLP